MATVPSITLAVDQRPSAEIASQATPGSATNAATARAVSGVSVQGHTEIALAGARYRYTKTLWITGLADRLPRYDTLEQAIAALADGSADG